MKAQRSQLTLEALGRLIVCRILPHLDCHSLRNLLAVSEFLRSHALLILPPPDGTTHLIQPLFSSLTGIRSTTEKALSVSPPQEPTIKLYEVYDDNKGNIDDLISRTLPKLDRLSFVHVRFARFSPKFVLELIRPRIFIDFHAQTTDSYLDARETKELPAQKMTSLSRSIFSGSKAVYDMQGIKSLRLCVKGDFKNMKFPQLENLLINFSEGSKGLRSRAPRFTRITARSLKVLRVHYYGRLPLMSNLSFQPRLDDISMKMERLDHSNPNIDRSILPARVIKPSQEVSRKAKYLEIFNLNGQASDKHSFFEDTHAKKKRYMNEMELTFTGCFTDVTLSGVPMWLLDYMKLRCKNVRQSCLIVINTVKYAESSNIVSIVQPYRDRVSFNLLNTVPGMTLPQFTRDRIDPKTWKSGCMSNGDSRMQDVRNVPQVYFREIIIYSTNTFSFGKFFDSKPSPLMSLRKLVIELALPPGQIDHPVIPTRGVEEILNSNWLSKLRINGCYLGPNNEAFRMTFPSRDKRIRHRTRAQLPDIDVRLALLPTEGQYKEEFVYLTTLSMLSFRQKVTLKVTEMTTHSQRKRPLVVKLSGDTTGTNPSHTVRGPSFDKIYVV